MEERKIVIIGCGATGLATAAWCEKNGFSVILCDTKEQFVDIELLKRQGGIRIRGIWNSEETIPIHYVTTDIVGVINKSRDIVICVSAKRQEEISQLLAPHLNDGQAVLFSPGNLGAVILKREQEKLKNYKQIFSAELSGNLWACRMESPGCVTVALPMSVQKMAAYPAEDTQMAAKRFSEYFPIEAAKNVAETVLNSPNIITHLAGTILNMADVERKKEDFSLFKDGLSEGIISVFRVLEKERNAVLSTYGLELYERESCELLMRKLMGNDTPEGLLVFKELKGPSSMKHRYVSEDSQCGIAFLVSMAKEANVEVPTTEALLTLASTINKKNYYASGRTLYNMKLLKEELEGDEKYAKNYE